MVHYVKFRGILLVISQCIYTLVKLLVTINRRFRKLRMSPLHHCRSATFHRDSSSGKTGQTSREHLQHSAEKESRGKTTIKKGRHERGGISVCGCILKGLCLKTLLISKHSVVGFQAPLIDPPEEQSIFNSFAESIYLCTDSYITMHT